MLGATAESKLANQRAALLRAIYSICRLCEREAPVASNGTAYKRMPIPYHGRQLRTKDNHSNLFQMAKRKTEAGEDSVQRRGKSVDAGMASNERGFEQSTWFMFNYSQSRSSGRLRTVHRIPSHLVYRKHIMRHPFLPQVRHFLSRTQSVQQVRGHRSP